MEEKPKRADVTRAALIRAAEKLIATKGLADVSTREILRTAGQRNQSALQYHFGSKNGLIRAAINERTLLIDEKRIEMLDALGENPSLTDLLDVFIRPLAELAEHEDAGVDYVIFLSQAITRPDFSLDRAIEEIGITGLKKAYSMLDDMLTDLTPAEIKVRRTILFDLSVITIKHWCLQDKPKKTINEILHLLNVTSKELFLA
ncbi:TetR/AcrR family transcriptional regulator [Kordiimonas sp. SCSIO 12610]|uniref:TetR/AcrR family transcriptional regulator n=1 Tax=Kordiimonas sp. SCSIO 12610 TaxID=2829597 RepID=UPI00210C898E|nr:TetR/AcrR family transcriptional regulator [Kordiimonas sp. SCSIO 12610]UTW55772.1 TetR/AcrR family transcriptional regulator [Kordiimonas sp. SCSIO 12610]